MQHPVRRGLHFHNAAGRAAALAITLLLAGCTDELDYEKYFNEPVPDGCTGVQTGQAGDWKWMAIGRGPTAPLQTDHPNDYAGAYLDEWSVPAIGAYTLTPLTVKGVRIEGFMTVAQFPWSFVIDAGPLNAAGRPVYGTVTVHAFSGERAIPPFTVEAQQNITGGGGLSWAYEFKMNLHDIPITRLTLRSDNEIAEDISLPVDGVVDATSQAVDAAAEINKRQAALHCPYY
jgi:hypothetical protein